MQFYSTVSSKELRPSMPSVPVLLSAASFLRQRTDGTTYLIPPRLPAHITTKGADCGGFTAATRWNGTYRFTPAQYVRWLSTWKPQWAATIDLPCLGDPGERVVRMRQDYTTKMAELFWDRFRLSSWCWCPTITGWCPSDYERHARALAPLIRAMFLYYSDPGWGDEEDEQSAFRIGVGSLCGRAKPAFVLDIIQRISAIIGPDIPLHCWGVKLRTLQARVELPGVISLDSGAWNNLWGHEHDRRRASGLTVVDYSWHVSHPAYQRKIADAQAKPQQRSLPFFAASSSPLTQANSMRHFIADSLAEGDGRAEELLRLYQDNADL